MPLIKGVVTTRTTPGSFWQKTIGDRRSDNSTCHAPEQDSAAANATQ
jgi:hypothetical protein